MRTSRISTRFGLFFALAAFLGFAQPCGAAPAGGAAPIPRIVEKDGRHALLIDDAPFLILGAQTHNSSAWPAMAPKVWPAMDYLQVNTVEMPVYWEQIEPRRGAFDFTVVDALIADARRHRVRLVLLWFGTWKNGSAHYRPEWMKLQPGSFPNMVGKDGKPIDSPSPHSTAAQEEDARAFSVFMGHLKKVDPQRTVIMVQVQNEPGSWGGIRDFSPEAQRLFNEPVPDGLLRALDRKSAPGANWTAVFGDDADEFFHAWSVARYIEVAAAAGKAVYPLPLFTNAALKDPFQVGRDPGYEFGGPTHNVLHIWKAAAPSLDFLAPDIYLQGTDKVLKALEQYARPDNALFVPEISRNSDYARFFYATLGEGGIGFAPFGIDYSRVAADPAGAPAMKEADLTQLAISYQAVGPMMREMAQWVFDDKVQAAVESEQKTEPVLSFPGWDVQVKFGTDGRGNPQGNPRPIGRVLVAQSGPSEFVVTAFYANVSFRPTGEAAAGQTMQFLSVDEGQFVQGQFKRTRIWNGDETDWGLNFTSAPQVLKVRLGTR